jgi:hypothetical protein
MKPGRLITLSAGIYILLFGLAFMTLSWKRKTQTIPRFYLFFCCFLFSCCTIHVFIHFRYMYKDLVSPTSNDLIRAKMCSAQVEERQSAGTIEVGTPALRTADALVTLTDFFAELVLVRDKHVSSTMLCSK